MSEREQFSVVEVVPMSSGPRSTPLSYFAPSDTKLGEIVEIEIRKKKTPAIVVSKTSSRSSRMALRGAKFSLKKVKLSKDRTRLGLPLLEAARAAAGEHASDVGKVILAFVKTESLASGPEKLKDRERSTYTIQATLKDRLSDYKNIVRENFASRLSVVLYTPNVQVAENLHKSLSKGIESRTHLLHPKLTKKKQVEVRHKILESGEAVLIITTASDSVFGRGDIGAHIVERAASTYHQLKLPYLDFLIFAKNLSEELGSNLYYGDTYLPLSVLYQVSQRKIEKGNTFLSQMGRDKAQTVLVDQRDSKAPIISAELEELLRSDYKRMVLVVGRKGLHPLSWCADCEETLLCQNCGKPLVLHERRSAKKEHYYKCHSCTKQYESTMRCSNCNGWRLYQSGIGIETVSKVVKGLALNTHIYVVSSDQTKEAKQLREFEDKGGILITTPPYLLRLEEDSVDLSAIVSLDHAFGLSEYTVEDQLFRSLLRLKEVGERSLVQTRLPERKVFELGLKGDLLSFYRHIIESREKYSLPPTAKLIKLSVRSRQADKMSQIIKKALPEASIRKNGLNIEAYLSVPEADWPKDDILARLYLLPPNISVEVR